MIVNKVILTIDNFNNAAMVDDRSGEVARMLREMANRVESDGVVNAFEGRYLKDTNGNTVGLCDCDWSEDDEGYPKERQRLEAIIHQSLWSNLYIATLRGSEFLNCYGQGESPEMAMTSLEMRVNQLRAIRSKELAESQTKIQD